MNRLINPRLLSDVKLPDYIYSSLENISIEANTNKKNIYKANLKGILKIEITDNGCGIPEDAVKNLFQAFRQADSSITKTYGGTGLGLYITKQIIDKMGGDIYVYSKKNIGTCFSVLLPMETAEETQDNKLNSKADSDHKL